MRPLKITISAFGPYAGEQVIDFSELNGRNIFLITGPTGAGKTTIFDAICYAIYGKGSGRDRDGENMRSDFAAEDTATFVELEFELNNRRYWIKRKPKQLRPKSKGGGFTEQGAEAEFREMNTDSPDTIAGIREVNEKMQQVLGITYEQFKQIIMIPQGEFRELLTTESKDRESILQRIFGTEGFKRVQDRLGDLEKALRDEVRILSGQRDDSIKRLKNGSSEILPDLIAAANINVAAVIEEADRSIAVDEQQELALVMAEQMQEALAAAKQQEIFGAQEVQRKLTECIETAKRKDLLERQLAEFETKEAALAMGRKTLALQGLEDNCRIRQDGLKRRQDLLTLAEEQAAQLLRKAEAVKSKYEAEQTKEPKRVELQEQIRLLKGYIDKVGALEAARTRHNGAATQLRQAEQQAGSAKEAVDTARQGSKDVLSRLEAVRSAAADYATQSAELENRRQLSERVLKLKQENEQLQSFRRVYEQQQSLFKKEKEVLELQQNQYEHIKREFLKGQAGLLAKTLTDGQACPVCGSQHHPAPAALAEGIPTEEELKKAETLVQKLGESFEKARSAFEQVKAEGLAQRRTVENLQRELAGHVGQEVTCLEKEALTEFVQAKAEQLAVEVCQLSLTVKQLEQSKQQEQTLNEQLKALQETLTTAEKQADIMAASCTASLLKEQGDRQEVERLSREIPIELQGEQKLMLAVKQAEEELGVSLEALKLAEADYRQCCLDYEKKLTEREACQQALTEASLEWEAASAKFAGEMNKAGFAEPEEYARAKMNEQQIAELDQLTRDYRHNLALAREYYNKAMQQAEGLVAPDTARLEEELAVIRAEKARLAELRTEIFARIKHNKDTLSYIRKLHSELADKELEYGILADLANTAKGNNEERLSFERYVLAAFFEDIIEAANVRLGKMTGGRYEMGRIRERGKGAAQSGLEIEVFDNYTGRARHIKTLSGGESFKASLALALGLADVVQSYAGGISLETMFIDEGFGTLDPESLDSAINCLVELQHSGRLVGIISHVPELKACIDARLEIEAAKDGSKAKFFIA